MMEKPKVLIYTDCFVYGGSERLMIFLLKNKKLNEEFDLLFAFRNHKEYFKSLSDDIKNLKINIAVYPLFGLANATFFNKLNRSKLPLLVKNIIKLPFFLLQKSGIYFVVNFFSFLYDKFIYKYVKYFITASIKAGDALIEKRKFNKEKIVQIPNTVLLETVTKTRMNILEELQWQESSFIVVQVAFLTGRKGQINVINAVQLLRDERTPDLSDKIKLILVGDGEDEQLLRKFVSEKDINDAVCFAGYRSDSVNYINACDIFALPSIANEDMPLSLLTAMSYGKPILATNFAGIAEVISDRENGLLLDPNPETIVEKICTSITELYTKPDVRISLAHNAKKTFHERFSEDIYAKRLSNLYARV